MSATLQVLAQVIGAILGAAAFTVYAMSRNNRQRDEKEKGRADTLTQERERLTRHVADLEAKVKDLNKYEVLYGLLNEAHTALKLRADSQDAAIAILQQRVASLEADLKLERDTNTQLRSDLLAVQAENTQLRAENASYAKAFGWLGLSIKQTAEKIAAELMNGSKPESAPEPGEHTEAPTSEESKA